MTLNIEMEYETPLEFVRQSDKHCKPRWNLPSERIGAQN